MKMFYRIIPFGDSSLIVKFKGERIEVIKRVKATLSILISKRIEGVIDFIPAISSLTIVFDPLTISFVELRKILESLLIEEVKLPLSSPRVFEIPTVYGGRFGPDLSYVAKVHNISEEEVIKIHTGGVYRVYMIGFIPGFAYLGDVSEKIRTERLRIPRIRVPKGSVGIGENFTGIYPLSSPGGWRIIGMTYFNPFNPKKIPPVEFDLLDIVKFKRISEREFLSKYREKIEFLEGEDD